jgi:hypothetical protein
MAVYGCVSKGTGVSGRVDEVLPCEILVDRFNLGNRQWDNPVARPGKREDGVDVVARHLHGGRSLQFQVTRVGVAEKTYTSVDSVVDVVHEVSPRLSPSRGVTTLGFRP